MRVEYEDTSEDMAEFDWNFDSLMAWLHDVLSNPKLRKLTIEKRR